MADILIKNLEMPESCFECDGRWPNCPFEPNSMFISGDLAVGRHKDCPLIELPSHGRLIDADTLIGSAYEIQRQTHVSFPEALAQAFMDAPTVLEAST